uniref:Fibrinogen C-terminal domain-containing protein n=1 Tax=Macrostomum lignano TaxID=282301 RepID=A0A1I8HZN2_9PLAT
DVLQCAAQAAKHLLAHQLLVFIPRDGAQQPQCIVAELIRIPANRSGAVCRRLTPHTHQSPCCIRVFVTSLSDCWISIQRRVDNSTDFYRNWTEYAAGFGEGAHTNHWLSLRAVHSLTWPSGRALRMRMRLWNGTEFWADYSSFSVASEADKFRLSISGFSASHPGVGDCMAYHNGMKFSTHDKDNNASRRNCAKRFRGSWWYSACHRTNPNGLYFYPPAALHTEEFAVGINWYFPFGFLYSLKEIEMLI